MTEFSETVLVPLPLTMVTALSALRRGTEDSIADVVSGLIGDTAKLRGQTMIRPAEQKRRGGQGRYKVHILGENIAAATLVEVLAKVLNTLADRDPAILDTIAEMGGRTRRHIAREPRAIYPVRSDLAEEFTFEFRPGWWVGTNYSRADIERILGDVCRAAGVEYGRDIQLVHP